MNAESPVTAFGNDGVDSCVSKQRPEDRLKHSKRFSDIWRAPLHDFPIRDEILYQYAEIERNMDVLELGPGNGFTAFWLARQVCHLTLVDVSAENVKQLRQLLNGNPNVDVVCADVCSPELKGLPGPYDVAFGLEVFELLPDPAVCLENLARVLRPGGQLLLQFPNYPPHRSPGEIHFEKRSDLEQVLRSAGFQEWTLYALQLSPHARLIYRLFHERPLKHLRRIRERSNKKHILSYEQSWAFRSHPKLTSWKALIHTAWAILEAGCSLGGDCFQRQLLPGEDIFNCNLLLIARR